MCWVQHTFGRFCFYHWLLGFTIGCPFPGVREALERRLDTGVMPVVRMWGQRQERSR